MYKNFTLTESEREQILNQHKEHGYKTPLSESFDSMASNIEPYSKFESTERLMKSITDRLITAVQLQEWSLVEEVVSDLISFKKKEQSNEPSSVESDDYDERQERNYGVED